LDISQLIFFGIAVAVFIYLFFRSTKSKKNFPPKNSPSNFKKK